MASKLLKCTQLDSSLLPLRFTNHTSQLTILSPIPMGHGLQLQTININNILHKSSQWRSHQLYMSLQNTDQILMNSTATAWILCFIASAVSTACGVGGGSLFLPILTVVAGLSLKTATAFNSFMVSAGAISNVIYAICFLDKSLVNYEITLLSQPCMLLGVSIGVLCNFMFPEWLITALFAVVLAMSTAKTLQSGCKIWRSETEKERGVPVEADHERALEPLLMDRNGRDTNGKDLVVLLMIWMCFFVLHILLGDKNGKGVIDIKPCGVTYWLVTMSQIPIAIGFTLYILYTKRERKEHEHANRDYGDGTNKEKFECLPKYVFAVVGLLTGALSGLFGIGGGLILNPAFLQMGVPPQTAAATSSLMVLFSASMSMVQYILLGMRRIEEAVEYGVVCFVAAVVGLVIMHRVIGKWGRVSVVVFVVSVVMGTSTVVITWFGAVDVRRQMSNGEYMGFKWLC